MTLYVFGGVPNAEISYDLVSCMLSMITGYINKTQDENNIKIVSVPLFTVHL